MEDILRVGAVLAVVIGVPMLCVTIIPVLAKAISRRIDGGGAEAEQGTSAELEAMRAEVDALRELAPRVLELEERVDFAERLLARQGEPERLESAREDRT